MDALRQEISAHAQRALGGESALVTRERQARAIKLAGKALAEARGATGEIAAELLRGAGDELGRLSGRIAVDDVLDRLFSKFCIGK